MDSPDDLDARRKARRYLLCFALAAVAVVGTTLLAGIASYRMRDVDPTNYLVTYQAEKLARGGKVDTVFLGDSSLGNGIDAAHFDAVSGHRSLNLALTGSHGYEGSFNMLKRAVRAHPEIRNVVLVQTVDMLQRLPALEGYFYTLDWSHWSGDLGDLTWREKASLAEQVLPQFISVDVYKTLRKRLKSGSPKEEFIDSDYIRQRPPVEVRPELAAALKPSLRPDKLAGLERIARYCREAKLNLVVAHGPIYSGIYDRSRSYFDLVRTELTARGIPLIPEVVTASAGQMGDNQDDHIAGRFKKEFTEKYYAVLRDRLVRE